MHFTAFVVPFIIFVAIGVLLPIALASQAMGSRIENH